ncbi:ATP-binding protein [Streptomyces sp. ST2-7A]|uniref:ATP-binding protein n=1 Tax=Streptomyces sp. ST2-7A TaxID=2907214 RepID=UPI001F33115F|nr:ATP-binding protein [Streptomyces sp. ST2-7A]MCE7078998.1 ATP-binding protein [Streptomyces sp. ST2-7A]
MHEYTSRVRVWELTCPGLLEEVGRARRFTRDVLAQDPRRDDAALIVTELAANAIRHTDSARLGFRLVISRTPELLTVAVTDAGGTDRVPVPCEAGDEATGGRGLALVQDFSHRLHIHRGRPGHTITAELTATEARPC